MEDSSYDRLVDEIIGCALTADPSKNLQLILQQCMKTPNFVILSNVIGTCITRALDKQDNEYFELAEMLGLWLTVVPALKDRELIWTAILTEEKQPKLLEDEKSRWCWEKFFDLELRNNRNANQYDEQMRILYNTKRLSLFRAKHHSKVLFRLLKLGADPFEQKQSKDKTHTKTLTYSIISSKKLTRVKRIHLLNHLLKRNLLRLDPSGRQGISPLQLCLTDQRKRHALKILLKVGSFDKVLLKGDNILLESNINHRYYENILSYLTVEQIKQLLKQPNDSYRALYCMRQSTRYTYFENTFTALIEIAQEFPRTIQKLSYLLPEHVFVQHFGQHVDYPEQLLQKFQDAVKTYQSHSKQSARLSKSDLKFNGNTEFPFEHLPVELSEMICSYLPMQDRMQLLSTHKSMRSLQDAFGEYYWKTALKLSFPVVYSQLENKFETRSWHDRTLSAFRSAENWKQGKFTKKFIRYNGSIQTPYGHHFDEHWLCAGRGSNLMFWNCTNGSEEFEHYLKLPEVAISSYDMKYLSSTPSAMPNIVFTDSKKFGYCVNNNFKTFNLAEQFPRPKMPNPERDPYQITVLTEKTFIVRYGIFDIELEKAVAKFPEYNIRQSEKLLFSDNIISATYNTLEIFDKDLRRVSKSDPFSKSVENLSTTELFVLDEHLVYYSAIGYPYDNNHYSVVDIRTMKKVSDGLQRVYNVNNAGRSLSVEKGVCIIRNVKNSTWETTFPLPNEATEFWTGNSQYIVFGSHTSPKNSTMVVLDFDSPLQ